MTIDEWSARWKRNDDYPACANCGGTGATREHHFVQTWCRGKKTWDAESLCVACGAFTRRRYVDPDFRTPEQVEAAAWAELMKGGEGGK
jgi:5-methylcytosine-specific restriction endonuclease McrA